MGYRRYRSYRYRHWGPNPPSKYDKLKDLFGSAVDEIVQHFFSLDADAMDELLSDYGAIHGKPAETYARNTLPKWKSGATTLSGRTMERLIELVPPYLSAKQRLNLLKPILAKHERTPPTQVINVNLKEPQSGLSEIDGALGRLRVTDELAYLPARVMDAAKWLYDDDMTAARAALVSIAAVETEALRQSALREIGLLKRTLQSGQVKAASYTVTTPGGNLNIVAFTPSKCYIATLCFGEADSRTKTFRRYRDQVLLNSALGRSFVVWYYSNAEAVSHYLSARRFALLSVRTMLVLLEPLVRIFLYAKKKQGAK